MNIRQFLWPSLDSVPAVLSDLELRRQSLLLARLLRVVIVLGGISVTMQAAWVPDFKPAWQVLVPTLGLLVLAAILNAYGWYSVAGMVTVTVMLAGCLGVLLVYPQDPLTYAYLVLPLFLARLFLPGNLYLLIPVSAIAGLLGVAWIQDRGFTQAIAGSIFLATMAVLFGVARQHRRVVEQDRRAALATSEHELRAILDNMQDTYYRTDPEGRIVLASASASRLLGYLQNEVTGKHLADFYVDPDGRADFLAALEAAQGKLLNYEAALRHRDGSIVWVSTNAQYVRDDQGRISGVEGTTRDITERKHAEESLLEVARGVSASSGELFFHSLVEHLARALRADVAFVGELVPDRPDHVRTIAVLADGESRENFEYALAGTPCEEVVGRETCASLSNVQEQYPEDRMLVDMGVQAYVGTPLFKSDGTALGLVAVLFRQPIQRDTAIVSALEIFATRVSTELERLRSEAQMRKLSSAIEQTADAVMITDPHGVIEYVNPAFEQGTGYSLAEALGQTPRLIRSGKQGQGFYRKLWTTILAGETFSDVLINRRKDGTYYYEEKTITPLKDAHGQVTHFISTGKDVTERMQAQEKLEFMAQHDALTELPNRALLLDRLKQSVARARWHRRMVAVLFVDLDRFKTINDTLGHEAGDLLLQQLGERFSQSVREGDTVARFGGDEFAILLDDVASDKDIGGVAQKILDVLKAPFEIARQYLYITASIGISLFPNDGEDGATLLKHADIAMYRAKELGKNTYQFYSSDMSARAFERLSLETSLRHALDRHEFVLHYQPQIDARTGQMFGVEALLRWQHPDFGLVPPADFIALLEETGLIVPAGEWVLEEASRQLQGWHAAGHRQLRLAVNLSPRQVQSPGLVAAVERALRRSPDETGWLELEITEGLLVQQSPALMEKFDMLRALGVRLAVDDFGTGYSSLSYLRRLPIDSLKIDRSFVRDVPTDADDSAITTTIIAMAQSLRLEVIAEGVENEAQRDFLSAYGCHRMQGYLFARPMPAADISRLLAGGG